MTVDLGSIVTEPVHPREAIEFFRSKGYAPADARFDYRDWWGAAHARAFVVAKAMQDDVLTLIRTHVDRALAEGRTLDQFRADLAPELKRLGWWGQQDMRDPVTGEMRAVRLGSQRRLRVIFDTNMRTAHAAGRWARIQRVKATLPYLQYIQIQRPTKRENHAEWHLMVLPVDHPDWAIIYPPNGWFCGCITRQLSAGALERQGLTVSQDAGLTMRPVPNNRTGGVDEVPAGVTPGFAQNPGAEWLALSERVDRVAHDLPARIVGVEHGLSTEVRARGIRDGVEHAALYSLDDGTVIDWARGEAGAVEMTPRMQQAMSEPPGRLALVHNHPLDEDLPGFTLSAPDFEVLQHAPGLAAISAVGHDGSVYRATRLVDSFAISRGALNVDSLARRAAEMVIVLRDRGIIPADEWRQVHSLVVARALHEAGMIDYRHDLTLAAQQIYTRNRQVIGYLAEQLAREIADVGDH